MLSKSTTMHNTLFADANLLASWALSLATLNKIAVLMSIIASGVAIWAKIMDRRDKNKNGSAGDQPR